jgi:hypothetical protein
MTPLLFNWSFERRELRFCQIEVHPALAVLNPEVEHQARLRRAAFGRWESKFLTRLPVPHHYLSRRNKP